MRTLSTPSILRPRRTHGRGAYTPSPPNSTAWLSTWPPPHAAQRTQPTAAWGHEAGMGHRHPRPTLTRGTSHTSTTLTRGLTRTTHTHPRTQRHAAPALVCVHGCSDRASACTSVRMCAQACVRSLVCRCVRAGVCVRVRARACACVRAGACERAGCVRASMCVRDLIRVVVERAGQCDDDALTRHAVTSVCSGITLRPSRLLEMWPGMPAAPDMLPPAVDWAGRARDAQPEC
jgi:hypothetical protein